MKIIAVGRNYAEHAKELNNPVPAEPIIFIKPDTALLRNGEPFYLPAFSNEINYEVEVVLQVGKAGKHINKGFALNYIDALTVGIDFTARDIQRNLKEKGLPWELAKGFDYSAPVGRFVAVTGPKDLDDISFSLLINGAKVQEGNSKDMIYSFAEIIAFVSERITLRKGDYIFTGTPPGVGKVNAGDLLEGYMKGEKLMSFSVK